MNVEIIADSLHPFNGTRLTTLRLKVPTVVLAQFGTHRMISKNAASMRAIPTRKILRAILDDPYIPPEIGSNKAGMQAGAPLSPTRTRVVIATYLSLMLAACGVAWFLSKLGVAKQVVNRVVSPWAFTTVVATANDRCWRHFFALRDHPDADPALRQVAAAAHKVWRQGKPKQLAIGEWHLPFVDLSGVPPGKDWQIRAIKHSVARSARTSYATFDDPTRVSTIGEDEKLYEKLVGSDPKHASPTEHQAWAVLADGIGANFGDGWMQHRHTIAGEYTK